MIRKDARTIITDKRKIANEFKNMSEEMLNQPENRTTAEVNVTVENYWTNQRYKKLEG